MASPYLIGGSLLGVTVAIATQLSLWREESAHDQTRSGSVMEILMGDSRRLFANHFVTKADVYLHSGVYPSIFDQAQRQGKSHLASATVSTPGSKDASPGIAAEPDGHHHEDGEPKHEGDCHGGAEEHDAVTGFLDKPHDWIDAFGRNFFPTKHIHLGAKGDQREILPWLRLAADLNPNDVEIYPLAAYWLRQRMGKVKEAEAFLREGWRANPNSFEILFELGRLYEENRQDDRRARNLFEAALRKWQENEAGKEKPDEFTLMQITGHLARLEERAGNMGKSIEYLERLRKLSPSPDAIQKQIDDLRAKAASTSPVRNG